MTEAYWTISKGVAPRAGWTCRECKRGIGMGESYVSRDGRKLRFYYHISCFSGEADPRTQPTSHSYATTKFGAAVSAAAPVVKGKGKWSTSYGSNTAHSSTVILPSPSPSGSKKSSPSGGATVPVSVVKRSAAASAPPNSKIPLSGGAASVKSAQSKSKF